MLHDVNILVAVVIMVICSSSSNNNSSTTTTSSSIIHRCNHLLSLTVSFQVVTEAAGTTLGLHSNNKIHMI